MIDKYSEGLFEIYKRAPLYGVGKADSLNHQFGLYRNILQELGSMEKFKAATHPLIVQCAIIETLITDASNEDSDHSRANFENALKLLSNDIRSLLEILKFSSDDHQPGLGGPYTS